MMLGEWARWLVERIPRGRFTRRLLTLSGGTMLAQALLVLATPVLTRLFTPEEFGILIIFSNLAALLAVTMAWRLEFAIPIAKSDRDASHLVFLALMIVPLMALSASGLLWLFSVEIADFSQTPLVAPLMPLMLIVLGGYGLGAAFNYLSIRRGTFKINALSRMVLSATQVSAQIVAGLMGWGAAGLILGYTIGFVVQFAFLWVRTDSEDLAAIRQVEPGHALALLRQNWRFPVFTMPATFLQSGYLLMPALLVAALYGPALAGLFGLAQRITTLPIRLIGMAASQVFLVEAAERDAAGVHRLVKRTAWRFAVVGFIGMLPFLLAGPALFAFAFGESWRQAGAIVQVLVPFQMARLVMIPISQTMNILGHQHIDLWASLCVIIMLVGSFWIGHSWALKPMQTLLLFSVSTTLVMIGNFIVVLRVAAARAQLQTS